MSNGNVFLTTTYYGPFFPEEIFAPPYLDIGTAEMLFQIASALVFATNNNATLYVPSLNVYFKYNDIIKGNSIFRNINTDFSYNYLQYNTIYYDGEKNWKYCDDQQIIHNYSFYDNIHFKENPFLNYFNFDICYNLVLDTFSPNQTDIDYITTKYPYMLNLSSNTCGLCVYKFNDVESYLNSPYFYYLQTSALNLFKYLLSTGITNFIVFTNDITYMQTALHTIIGAQFPGVNIYVPFEKDYMNIWMLSLIPVTVVSHSWVSWWGAYLNKNSNKVIHYLNFTDPTGIDLNRLPSWVSP